MVEKLLNKFSLFLYVALLCSILFFIAGLEAGVIPTTYSQRGYVTDECPGDPNKTAPGVCGCGVPDRDSDGDGVFDCFDSCPSDSSKTSPGVCGCGVSDADSDGDGTPDCNDGCPSDSSKTSPGVCGCGVSDADSDGDGTPNCTDNCPSDGSKVNPGACGCGIPDFDSDGDGTPDCNDGCPSDGSKLSPGVCGCGTTDNDSDGDGVADCNDSCPSYPNDTVGDPCNSDEDGDGVADRNDSCPTQGDLGNGLTANGCPIISDPDDDGDGISNSADNCPSYPNDSIGDPCNPDEDGDGVPDRSDNCPSEGDAGFGLSSSGCPIAPSDRDGDGIVDSSDSCPDYPNDAIGDPCNPDEDGDGVLDRVDSCPRQGGGSTGVDASGCPSTSETDDTPALDTEVTTPTDESGTPDMQAVEAALQAALETCPEVANAAIDAPVMVQLDMLNFDDPCSSAPLLNEYARLTEMTPLPLEWFEACFPLYASTVELMNRIAVRAPDLQRRFREAFTETNSCTMSRMLARNEFPAELELSLPDLAPLCGFEPLDDEALALVFGAMPTSFSSNACRRIALVYLPGELSTGEASLLSNFNLQCGFNVVESTTWLNWALLNNVNVEQANAAIDTLDCANLDAWLSNFPTEVAAIDAASCDVTVQEIWRDVRFTADAKLLLFAANAHVLAIGGSLDVCDAAVQQQLQAEATIYRDWFAEQEVLEGAGAVPLLVPNELFTLNAAYHAKTDADAFDIFAVRRGEAVNITETATRDEYFPVIYGAYGVTTVAYVVQDRSTYSVDIELMVMLPDSEPRRYTLVPPAGMAFAKVPIAWAPTALGEMLLTVIDSNGTPQIRRVFPFQSLDAGTGAMVVFNGFAPVYSISGNALMFQRVSGTAEDIYATNFNEFGAVRLTTSEDACYNPGLTPEGKLTYFCRAADGITLYSADATEPLGIANASAVLSVLPGTSIILIEEENNLQLFDATGTLVVSPNGLPLGTGNISWRNLTWQTLGE